LKQANHYAQTKLMAETIVRSAFFHSQSAIAGVIIRPKAIISRYDRVILPRLRQSLERPLVPLPGGGRALLSLTHGDDVASALIKAAILPQAAGEDFNIAGDQPLGLRDMIKYVAQKLGYQPRYCDIPLGIAHPLGSILAFGAKLSGTEPLLTPYLVKTFGYDQTFDLTKAKTLLNWQPQWAPFEAIEEALCPL